MNKEIEEYYGKKYKGDGYPIYHIGKVILCEWSNGSISGFADEDEILSKIKSGELIQLNKQQ